MSRATDIPSDVKVQVAGEFVREYIDWYTDDAIAEVIDPAITADESDAVTVVRGLELERLCAFFTSWVDNQIC